MSAAALLRQLAEGESVPGALALQHYATSAHITTVTTARADGSIEIATTTGNHPIVRLSRGGDLSAMRAAAKLLVEAGFPRIGKPSTPPPHPGIPPVRVVVKAAATDSLAAEVSAASLGSVSLFGAAVFAIAALGTRARHAADAAANALDGLAGINVEVRFVPEAGRDRSFALRLAGGVLSEIERDGSEVRTVGLGPTTLEERSAVASGLRDSGFPRGHGSHRSIEGPHHVLVVEHGDVSVLTTSDADTPGPAIHALYAAATRFGMRPLRLS